MKKKAWIVFVIIAVLVISAVLFFGNDSSKIYKGTDALISKAREELPVSDADTIELQYAGLCGKEDEVLIWFISGNEYQTHYYLPIGFNVVGEDEYTFIRTFKPVERAIDIAVLQWKGGYSFIINNPKCVAIEITDNSGTHKISIEKGTYPYVFYNNLLPSEYAFLDKDGNEIN